MLCCWPPWQNNLKVFKYTLKNIFLVICELQRKIKSHDSIFFTVWWIFSVFYLRALLRSVMSKCFFSICSALIVFFCSSSFWLLMNFLKYVSLLSFFQVLGAKVLSWINDKIPVWFRYLYFWLIFLYQWFSDSSGLLWFFITSPSFFCQITFERIFLIYVLHLRCERLFCSNLWCIFVHQSLIEFWFYPWFHQNYESNLLLFPQPDWNTTYFCYLHGQFYSQYYWFSSRFYLLSRSLLFEHGTFWCGKNGDWYWFLMIVNLFTWYMIFELPTFSKVIPRCHVLLFS